MILIADISQLCLSFIVSLSPVLSPIYLMRHFLLRLKGNGADGSKWLGRFHLFNLEPGH